MASNINLIQTIINAPIEIVDVPVEDDVCKKSECQSEIQSLKAELENLNREISNQTRQYHQVLVSNLKKDLIIRKLKTQTENSFEEFVNELSRDTLNDLHSMDKSPEKDSSFILLLMRKLYQNQLHRLKNKTFSGRKKEPVTPEKVQLIGRVFKKRLDGQESADTRIKNIAKHIKSAIETINFNKKN